MFLGLCMIFAGSLNVTKGSANSRVLWGSVLFVLSLFVIVLFIMGVPQDIQKGNKAQIALKQLDAVNHSLLNSKTVISQFQMDGNVNRTKSEFEKLGVIAESSINYYKNVADYNAALSSNIVAFSAAYYRWFNAEYDYLAQHFEAHSMQVEDVHNKEHHLIEVQNENNALFLAAMALLTDEKLVLYDDIAKGQQACKVMQWAIGLLIVCFFTGFFLFQRNSSRVHAIREKNLEMTLRSIGEAVIATDIHGCITCMNPEAERLTGWSFKEAKSCLLSEVFRVVNAHSGMPADDLIVRVQREKGIVVLAEESILIAANGRRYQIYENGAPIIDDANKIIGVVLVFRDITQEFELKNAINENEKLIKKHNAILRETQRIAKLGYWELDLVNDTLEWSDEIFRIFDLDPAVTEPSYKLFLQVVHPEDRGRVETAYSESLKHKTQYNIIHRIVTDKGIRVVHEQCETSYDDGGEPVRSLGLVQDITERVSNLDELRLAATIFNSHAGIVITEKDGTIIRVNPAFEEMTGYSAAELVGMNPRIFQSARQSKAFYKKLWRELVTKGVWQGELWNKRRDGTLYAESLTITAVKDHVGEVTHYVGTSQDIARGKQRETEYLSTVMN